MSEIGKGVQILKSMKQIMDSIKQNIEEQFIEMNLTGPQAFLIGTLSLFGEMKISDLSEKLGLSNSTVSGIVDRLEKQGLVVRRRSTDDRRIVYVDVSPDFSQKAKNSYTDFQNRFEEMIEEASSEEYDIIMQGISTLKKVLDRNKKIKKLK